MSASVNPNFYRERLEKLSEIFDWLEEKQYQYFNELVFKATLEIVKDWREHSLSFIDSLSKDAQIKKYIELSTDMSLALSSIMNANIYDDLDNTRYLLVYSEYLQSIDNSFRLSQMKEGKENTRGNIFSLAFDFNLQDAKMNSLFQSGYSPNETRSYNALCAIFLPFICKDDLKNIFRYLPMLTHEVTHNFKYISTFERNKFVFGYTMDCFLRRVLTELFKQIEDSAYNIFLNKDIDFFIQEMKVGFQDNLPENFLNSAHLDEVASVLHSFFIENKEYKSERINRNYPKGSNLRDILGKSFMELLKYSEIILDIEPYELGTKENEMLLKFLLNKDSEEISADDLKLVLDNITLVFMSKILDAVCKEFPEYEKENWENCVLSILENINVFSKCLEDTGEEISKISPNDMYSYNEFADQMMSAKIDIDNIINICRLYKGEKIPVTHIDNFSAGLKIYEILNKSVEAIFIKEKSFSRNKIYFASKKTHPVILKLGLLDGEGNSKNFMSHYKKIFNNWDEDFVLDLLNEIIQVYREIYADLGMCAAFDFNTVGYFSYIKKYSPFEINDIFYNQTFNRAASVLRVLRNVSEKKGIWNDEKQNAERLLSHDDFAKYSRLIEYKGAYDDHYIGVYEKEILNSQWAKELRGQKFIQMIGEYYNSNSSGLSENMIEEAWELFSNFYNEKHEKRLKKYHENNDLEPIKYLLED